jgi:hypothetical protein
MYVKHKSCSTKLVRFRMNMINRLCIDEYCQLTMSEINGRHGRSLRFIFMLFLFVCLFFNLIYLEIKRAHLSSNELNSADVRRLSCQQH